MNRQEMFRHVKRATVAIAMVDARNSQQPFQIVGSGFCVDPEGLVVTCRHVMDAFMSKSTKEQIAEIPESEKSRPIQHCSPVEHISSYVVFYTLEPDAVRVDCIRVHFVVAKTDFDLALLRIVPNEAFQAGYPYLGIQEYEAVGEGDEIATCGFPLGSFLHDQLGTLTSSFTAGIVSQVIPSPAVAKEHVEGFQLGLVATYGNSGGPVFSVESGKVFGVLERGATDRQGAILPGLTKAGPVYPILHPDFIQGMKAQTLGKPFDFDKMPNTHL